MRSQATSLSEVVGSMAAWIVLFRLNSWFFGQLDWSSTVISWIFLPAAVRLLCVMLFDWRGALGLWLGTLTTNAGVFGGSLGQSLIVATLSAVGPLVALYVTMRWLRVPINLRGLTARQLAAFALVGALCNVIPHNLFFWLAHIEPSPFAGLIPMFVGDIVGTVIALYVLRGVLMATDRLVRDS